MMKELEALAPSVLAVTWGIRLIVFGLIAIAIIVFILYLIYSAIRDSPAKKLFLGLMFFTVAMLSFGLTFIFPIYALFSGWYWKTALASISIGVLLIPVTVLLDESL